MANSTARCLYDGCGGRLIFVGTITNDGFGRVYCEKCGKHQWKQNNSNIDETGWRLTIPVSRYQDVESALKMLPDGSKFLQEAFSAFGSLPAPRQFRSGQQGMGYGVALAIENNMVLLANAGVGIGKTFAYLIPLLQRFKRNPRGTVVISTRTILLQHQLLDDIEQAQKIIGTHVPVLVAKGRNQYLCMKKLINMNEHMLTDELHSARSHWLGWHEVLIQEHTAKLRAQTRIVVSRTGEADRTEHVYTEEEARKRAELFVSGPETSAEMELDRKNFESTGDEVWQLVQVDNDSPCKDCSLRKSCGFYQLRATRYQFQGIIVANHGLLANDVYRRMDKDSERDNGLWPAPFLTIVDEAHWIEEALRKEGAIGLNPKEFGNLTKRIVHHLMAAGLAHGQETIETFKDASEQLADALLRSVKVSEAAGKRETEREEMRVQPFLHVEELPDSLAGVLKVVEEIGDLLILSKGDALEGDLSSITPTLTNLGAWMAKPEESPHVVWLDKRTIYVGSLDLTKATETLTQNTTVLASGTLGIGDDFSFIERTLGLDNIKEMSWRLLRIYAPSPFNYNKQMHYELTKDIPHPTKDPSDARDYALAKTLRALVVRHGRVLALFTRRSQIDSVRQMLTGIPNVLVEGDASAAKLAEKFRDLQLGIYLSTSSWEGLDAPYTGAVVIVQMPYPVPGDPWVEAKCRVAEQRGENKFRAVIDPMMQMRTMQGVGRLIRRETDNGVVYVLDPRAAERFDQVLGPVLPSAKVKVVSYDGI